MGPLLAFTPVMWFTARCCNDSSCGYGVLWGVLWTPNFFLGLGLWFRPRGWVGLDCIGVFIYIRHSLHRISRHVMDFR
jgi:hypothetical protein